MPAVTSYGQVGIDDQRIQVQLVAHRLDRIPAQRLPQGVQRITQTVACGLPIGIGPEVAGDLFAADPAVRRGGQQREQRQTPALGRRSPERIGSVHQACATVALWSASGCAPALQGHGAAPGGPSQTTHFRLQVNNQYTGPINVSLIDGGLKTRLGMVLGMASEVFRVSGRVVTPDRELRLVVEPVDAVDAYVSDIIRIRSGQGLRLQVGSHVLLSQYFIR
jgi:hypothetical protein